jgi:phosphoribosylformylglycinamidine (FGAM) synthase-like amidotransferase family enzyme
MKPTALVLQAHGSNRDLDVMAALSLAGADATGILGELRSRKRCSPTNLLILPGGFLRTHWVRASCSRSILHPTLEWCSL